MTANERLETVQLSGCRVELARHLVHRDQTTIRLTALEVRLLAALIATPNRDVPSGELERAVWGHEHPPESRTLYNAVRRLRNKIEVDPKHPAHLIGIHGTGFRLSLPSMDSASTPTPSTIIRLGRDTLVDLDRLSVRTGDATQRLTMREAAMIRALWEAGGMAVARDELIAATGVQMSDRALDNAMHRLRKRLGEQLIVTERGIGYRLAPGPAPAGAARALVGRGHELSTILDHLATGSGLITLVGPPGSGKSHLARAVAAKTGAVHVDAGDATSAHELRALVAIELGVDAKRDPDSAIAAALVQRGMALVLDNIDGCIDVVPDLTRAWTKHPVIATARSATGDPSERIVAVGPLEQAGAIELFIECWGDDPPPRRSVRGIVESLDRLPLAIVVGAEIGKEQGLEALLEAQDMFDMTVDLPDAHRTALMQLGVFAGGCLAAQALEVLDVDRPLDVLEGLVQRRLLHVASTPEGPRFSTFRFDFFQTDPHQPSTKQALHEAQKRHQAAYLALGERLIADLRGPRGRSSRSRLFDEHQNLSAAAKRTTDPDRRLRLLEVLFRARFAIGPFDDLIEQFKMALTPQSPVRSDSWVTAMTSLGVMLTLGGRRADAAKAYGAALEVAQEPLPRSRTLRELAVLHAAENDYPAAVATLEEALALPYPDGVPARVHTTAAWCLLRAGEDERARTQFDLGSAASTATGDLLSAALLLIQFAPWASSLLEAEGMFHAALRHTRATGDVRFEAIAHGRLGLTLGMHRRPKEARRHLLLAIELYQRVGYRRSEGIALGNISLLDLYEGHPEVARRRLEQAMAIHEAENNQASAALGEAVLAWILLLEGKADDAVPMLEAAAPLVTIQHRPVAGSLLACAYAHTNRVDDARRVLSSLDRDPRLLFASHIRAAEVVVAQASAQLTGDNDEFTTLQAALDVDFAHGKLTLTTGTEMLLRLVH